MLNSSQKLSSNEARKLVLLSQKLPRTKKNLNKISATQKAIEHLGYVQIDTISVIQRAHHHTLWNRNLEYETWHLEQLVQEKKVFEYWSHAAAYLPMSEYRYTLVRKLALKNNEQKHWYDKDEVLMNSVLKRIESEGPLMAKDFDNTGKSNSVWSTKPTKKALECLFMQGDLMISSRKNFQKVYDLASRVLPKNIDTSTPTQEEYARFLIIKYLQSNGLGQASQMCYLLKNTKQLILNTLNEMHLNKELMEVIVKKEKYYTLTNSLELLNKPLSKTKVKILSPFDNLLIQRKRTQTLFDFNYLLECYTPSPKRKYGYFTLPILWDGKLVARMDCKANKKESILYINNLVLEESLKKIEDFAFYLCKELGYFMKFNNCSSFKISKTTPSSFKDILEGVVKNI